MEQKNPNNFIFQVSEPNKVKVTRTIAKTNIHDSSSETLKNMRKSQPTDSQKSLEPSEEISLTNLVQRSSNFPIIYHTGTEDFPSNLYRNVSGFSIPTILLLCHNDKQREVIQNYIKNAKEVYNIDNEADVLVKVFMESKLKKENLLKNERGDHEEYEGSIVWEWGYKKRKVRDSDKENDEIWIPFPQLYQEIIENAYQNGENLCELSTKEFKFTLWKENNNMKIDFIKNQLAGQSGKSFQLRRDIKKIYIEGYVLRESRKLKVWQQVYLELKWDAIYEKNYQDDKVIHDVIPLQVIRCAVYEGLFNGKDYVFSLSTYNDDISYIAVASEKIALRWIYYIGIAQKKCLIKRTRDIVVEKEEAIQKPINDDEGRHSICFCSISTAAYKFPLNEASTIACEVFKQFLQDHPKAPITIYLVDYIEDSETLKQFRAKKPDDPRFHISCANLVELRRSFMTSWYIVNASNPKFSEGGSGTNRAIHESCRNIYTPSLQTITRKQYGDSAELSQAYPVLLPQGCPLRELQNVRYVIHVVGPNMNPKKPHYLGEDGLTKGKEELRKCYWNVLTCFWKYTGLKD